METKDINNQEYQLRINKVTDYILTGETPTDYIKRTRIEKAALLLKRNKELSATEIARLCGFSSLSLLSRNFRLHFSMTIREFRSLK